jgi:membrane-bound ClpP family serine protease
MRSRLTIGVAALLALMPVTSGSAADLKQSTMKDGRVVVSISGEIADGDTDRLRAAIKIANDAGKLVSSIRLNSGGVNGGERAEMQRVWVTCEG